MKKPLLSLLLFFAIYNSFAQPQKVIADCTITYSVKNLTDVTGNNLQNAVKIVYISGKQIRVDLSSSTFNQTIFYNDNTGKATVLKSIGESKYISTYTASDWQKENVVYNGIKILFTNNTKKILNYTCKEALLKLKTGNTYTVYYVPELLPSITENSFQFKNIPGLILQYETDVHNQKIQYTAINISFDPVPSFRFEIPTTGYKVLN